MSELFPHNEYNPDIVNQPEIEYRTAKHPFRMLHHCISNGEDETWVSTHCPVCFWNQQIGVWGSMVDKGTKFCRRCGQKIIWEETEDEQIR